MDDIKCKNTTNNSNKKCDKLHCLSCLIATEKCSSHWMKYVNLLLKEVLALAKIVTVCKFQYSRHLDLNYLDLILTNWIFRLVKD